MRHARWRFTILEKKCVEILHLFSSFIWSHLYASKESQQIDIVLIFTSLKRSFSIPTQRASGEPLATIQQLFIWLHDAETTTSVH